MSVGPFFAQTLKVFGQEKKDKRTEMHAIQFITSHFYEKIMILFYLEPSIDPYNTGWCSREGAKFHISPLIISGRNLVFFICLLLFYTSLL